MQSLMNNPVTRSNAPCLIVGIGYTTGSVRDLAQRAADYTPPLGDNATADERRQFGQADRFADFIDSELTAFLESPPLTVMKPPYSDTRSAHCSDCIPCFPTAVSDGIGSYPPRFGGTTGGYSTLCRLKTGWTASMPASTSAHSSGAAVANAGKNATWQGRPNKWRQSWTGAGPPYFWEYSNADHGNVPFYSLTDCVEYLREAWQR